MNFTISEKYKIQFGDLKCIYGMADAPKECYLRQTEERVITHTTQNWQECGRIYIE